MKVSKKIKMDQSQVNKAKRIRKKRGNDMLRTIPYNCLVTDTSILRDAIGDKMSRKKEITSRKKFVRVILDLSKKRMGRISKSTVLNMLRRKINSQRSQQ